METLQRVSKTQSINTEKPSVKSALRFSPALKAQKRSDNQLELGYKLLFEAEKQNDIPSLVDADFLIESGQPESTNHCYFDNISDKQGRRFSAPLQLNTLPTRLDSGSHRKNAYSNRKRIIKGFEAIAAELEKKSLFAYFITPTFPNLVGKNLEQNIAFIDEVAKRFRDDEYYKTFKGAYKKTEFTSGEARQRREKNIAFDYRIHGYNFHNHYVTATDSKFGDTSKDCKKHCKKPHKHILNRENPANLELTELYTQILEQVHLEMFGEQLKFKTESGLAVVDIRPVEINFDADGKIIREKSKGFIFEIAKYLTKFSSLSDLEPSELLSANNIFKHKKLIASTGIFNEKKGRKKRDKTNNNNNLQDKETTESLDKHRSSILQKLDTLLNFQNLEDSEKSRLSIIEGIEKSLSSILKDINKSGCKTMILKKIGIFLCQSEMRELWLRILKVEFKNSVRSSRISFLDRHPNAVITDLQGNTYKREKYAQRLTQNRLTISH